MVDYYGYEENRDYVIEMLQPIGKKILFVNHHSKKRDYPDIKPYDIVIHSWLRTKEKIEIYDTLYDLPICQDPIYVVANTEILYEHKLIPLIGRKGKQIFIFWDFTHELGRQEGYYFASVLIYEIISKYFENDKETIKKTAKFFVENEINSLTNKYDNILEELNDCYKRIEELSKEVKNISIKINALQNSDLSKEIKEIENIKNIPDVAHVVPAFRYIIVYTNSIVSYPIEGEKYVFGKYKITIDIINNNIKILNLTSPRDAYWKPSQHPHVDSNGKACWGTLAETIATLLIEKEYSTLVSIVIEFLKTVNLEDIAGRYYKEWPVYEEIKDGYDYKNPDGDAIL